MKYPVILTFLIVVTACSVSPKEISYGSDLCEYCKMTIVDKQHSAQMVTTKGKQYLFDAIECLVPFLKENPEKEQGLILVADYTHPGQLINAKSAHYLISPAIPSPMGAYLSAFSAEKEAIELKNAKGGKLFSFQELEKELK